MESRFSIILLMRIFLDHFKYLYLKKAMLITLSELCYDISATIGKCGNAIYTEGFRNIGYIEYFSILIYFTLTISILTFIYNFRSFLR